MVGDAVCVAIFECYVDCMVRVLVLVINIVDLDVIVFGGGVSKIDVLYEMVL